jgi:hypothetical protein
MLCAGRWDTRVTHVIVPKLVRNAKLLAGMAAGNWILSTDFVTASAAAHRLVDPVSCPLPVSAVIIACVVPTCPGLNLCRGSRMHCYACAIMTLPLIDRRTMSW